jgi:hypothetical protein
VIVDKVALHWHPITAADCQAATHLDLNTVSAQLNRLVKNGVLTKVSLPGATKLGFQVSERFFNIWYLMRASRRLRRRLTWFVEFLRIFYGEDDLRRRAEQLVQSTSADGDSPARLLAFASAVPDGQLRRRLEFRAIELMASEGIAAMRQVMDLAGEDAHLAPVVDRVQALRRVRTRIARSKGRWPTGHTASSIADLLVSNPLLDIRSKLLLSEKSNLMSSRFCKQLVEGMEDHVAGFGPRILRAIALGALPSCGEVTSIEELKQLLEWASVPSVIIVVTVLLTERRGSPLPGRVLHQVWEQFPQLRDAVLRAAAVAVRRDNWPRMRALVIRVTPDIKTPSEVAALNSFLVSCTSAGLAAEALGLLAEAGLLERLAPVAEVLKAVSEKDPSRLEALAPEMRAPALELAGKLIHPELAGTRRKFQTLAVASAVGRGRIAPRPRALAALADENGAARKPRSRRQRSRG